MTKAEAIVSTLLDSAAAIDPEKARQAIRIELERTDSMERAKEVALNNLSKDPDYYDKLERFGLRGIHRRSPQPINP